MQGKSTVSGDEVPGALLWASRALVAVSARSLAEAEEVVTTAQFRALVVLESRGKSNLVQLAEHLGVTSSTAHRMVERLVRAGLVERGTNPADRRGLLISLSAEGRTLVERVTARRRRELSAIARRMPVESRAAAVAALEAFSVAAGEPEPGVAGAWDVGRAGE